jgi:hypothetical protein
MGLLFSRLWSYFTHEGMTKILFNLIKNKFQQTYYN